MNESMKFANVIFQKCSLRLWDPQFFTIFMWNRVLAAVSRAFCRPHLPKVLRTWQFLKIFECKSSSRYDSRAHFAGLIFQKCCKGDSFWTFSNANPALATVSHTFCRPHLPKALRDWQFLNIFKCKSSSRYSLVRILSTTFADRGPQLSETMETTLPEKTQGFAPESLFKPEFMRPDLLDTLPTMTWCRGF